MSPSAGYNWWQVLFRGLKSNLHIPHIETDIDRNNKTKNSSDTRLISNTQFGFNIYRLLNVYCEIFDTS